LVGPSVGDEQQRLFEPAPDREDDELSGVVHRLRVEGDDPGAWPRLGGIPPPPVCTCPEAPDWIGRCLGCGIATVNVHNCPACARKVIGQAVAEIKL